MKDVALYTDLRSVNDKLTELGLAKEDLIQVALKSVMARNESLSIDPINTPGILGYIYGTRGLRELLLPKKWKASRDYNIEATKHPDRKLYVIFQNATTACDPKQHPQPLSPKGSGTAKLLSNDALAQMELNLFIEEPGIDLESEVELWYLCVAVSEDGVCAELSRLKAMDGSRFKIFSERIFLLAPGDYPPREINYKEVANVEPENVEFTITRRKEVQSN